jgi:predicted transcriptional regulator
LFQDTEQQYSKADLELAADIVMNRRGRLVETAHAYNIPVSTLSGRCIKLSKLNGDQEGYLSEKTGIELPKRKRNRIFSRYSPEDLQNAIEKVLTNGARIAPTAKSYNIPIMTLYDTIKRIKKRHSM